MAAGQEGRGGEESECGRDVLGAGNMGNRCGTVFLPDVHRGIQPSCTKVDKDRVVLCSTRTGVFLNTYIERSKATGHFPGCLYPRVGDHWCCQRGLAFAE